MWLVVSVVLTAIWALTGTDSFFWPVFPIAGWALSDPGLVGLRAGRAPNLRVSDPARERAPAPLRRAQLSEATSRIAIAPAISPIASATA